MIIITRSLFELGQTVMTANALGRLDSREVQKALTRHAAGDWGEICTQDAEENALALREGFRLFSVYGSGEAKFWIITEADRSVTTVLMPEDY